MVKNNKKFSLDENVLKNLLFKTLPSSQNQSIDDLNIGFGFLYYSLSRNFKPKNTVVLGSAKGFSPICFGLGIKDNNNEGKLYFVDAGYSDETDGLNKGMGGIAFWKDNKSVKNIFETFNLENIIKVYVTKTSQFLYIYKKEKKSPVDLLFIDADHTYEGFKFDFDNFSKLLSPSGIIVFHDVLVEKGHDNRDFGVKKYFEEISQNLDYEYFRFPIWPGLVILRKVLNKDNLKTNQNKKINELELKLNKIYSSKMWKILGAYKKTTYLIKKIIKKEILITNRLDILKWEELKKLRLKALKEEAGVFIDSYNKEILLPDEIWQNRLRNYNSKKEFMIFLVVENKLVGMAGAVQNPEDIKNKSATLCKIYINPENRGNNFSIKLIKKLFKDLKKQKIKSVHLFVNEDQKAAITIYQKIGFTIKGKESMVLGDRIKHTGLLMEKFI